VVLHALAFNTLLSSQETDAFSVAVTMVPASGRSVRYFDLSSPAAFVSNRSSRAICHQLVKLG
ncbi:hypothetical protein, partial [Streptosporangium roseum]|uniref:hypothetical protein n=1 Tax=Streptosporangium roseum TaxID=2001 RepID=UPI001E32C508